MAIEAVRRIDAIFDVERDINGLSAAQRHTIRQTQVAPLVTSLEQWMRAERGRLSRHADVAKAMSYMPKRWDAFTRFLRTEPIPWIQAAARRHSADGYHSGLIVGDADLFAIRQLA